MHWATSIYESRRRSDRRTHISGRAIRWRSIWPGSAVPWSGVRSRMSSRLPISMIRGRLVSG